MTKLIGIFCSYANAPKNYHIVEEVRDNERKLVGKEDNSQKRTDESIQSNKMVMN
jgi:membrane-bound lytic murein transglycosylase MltF